MTVSLDFQVLSGTQSISQSKRPQNIVFDIDNVLPRWDAFAIYRNRGIADDDVAEFFREVVFFSWNLEQDSGRSWDQAVDDISQCFPHRAEWIAYYRDYWAESILGEISGTVGLLQRLRDKAYPLYALTNFSARTWEPIVRRFPFMQLFRDIFASGHEGIVKPLCRHL